MPPLKHSRLGDSEVIKWMCKEFKIDAKLADAVFSSARHAKYVVMYNGHWRGDSLIGFFNWKKGGTETANSKEQEQLDTIEPEPEEPVLTPEEERAQRLAMAHANFKRIKESLGM